MTDPTKPDPAPAARPRGMAENVDPVLPDDASSVSFDCAACGAWAMRVILRATAPPDRPEDPFPRGPGWLELQSGLGRTSFRVTEIGAGPDPDFGDRAALIAAIEQGTPEALYRLNREFVPNWCPSCSAVYCRDHWRTWEVFDPDYPGSHEETRGVCPHGHERMLSD
jgi:hypothetical protein